MLRNGEKVDDDGGGEKAKIVNEILSLFTIDSRFRDWLLVWFVVGHLQSWNRV